MRSQKIKKGTKMVEENVTSKPADTKVDLRKSNPKEYYAQSSVKFKELSRNSQKLSDDIQKLSSQIEMAEAKIASLKATLSAKKGLFAVINSEINARVQKEQI